MHFNSGSRMLLPAAFSSTKPVMKNFFLFSLALLLSSIAVAQDDNHKVMDEKSGKEILIGSITREGLISMGDWFNEGYNGSQPDPVILDSLRLYKDKYPYIFIVLGTWCGDSREQVPAFLRILDMIGYPAEQVFMVAVDREKKAGNFCIGDFNIKLVPTFIMTVDGEETGRIIETPATTLEKDLLRIVAGR